MATYDTAANIINEAAIELGLGSVSDAYGSTDANITQLRTLLKSVGRSLVWRYAWFQQIKEHTFTTVEDEALYDLPADFQSMVDVSGYNRTTNIRLHPASIQQWAELESSESASTNALSFRLRNGEIELWPTPTTENETIAFEYRSKYWVALAGTTTATLDAPTANDNVIIIDSHLITRALKLAFLKAKGFDTTAAQQDFDEAMNAAQGANGASPILSVTEKTGWLLSIRNTPDTGFGFDDQGGLY